MNQSLNLSLLVNDCLRACSKRAYRVEFKYATYGGSYRDLPGYNDALLAFNRLIDEKRFNLVKRLSKSFCFYFIKMTNSYLIEWTPKSQLLLQRHFMKLISKRLKEKILY